MRIKVTLRREEGLDTDLVVTADPTASIGDVATVLYAADPRRAGDPVPPRLTLHVADTGGDRDGRFLEPDVELVDAGVRSGSTVTLTQAGERFSGPGADRGPTVAVLRVLAGPDAGREFPLPAGSSTVGRDRGADVRLQDPLVSKRHARVNVGDTIDITDLGSANGVLADGVPVPRVPLESGTTVTLGDSVVTVVSLHRPAGGAVRTAAVPFVRSPRVVPVPQDREIEAPDVPQASPGRRFPFVALVAPLLMGVVLYLVTRNPLSLIFVALSPIIMIGTWLDARITARRELAVAVERFGEALRTAREEIDAAHAVERAARLVQHPSSLEVAEAVRSYGPLLWSRRAEHEEFLTVRLGVGAVPSRCRVTGGDRGNGSAEDRASLRDLETHALVLSDAPVVASLRHGGNLGIAGDRERAAGLARAVVLQLAGLHSPADLTLAAVVPASRTDDWRWLTWLPHTGPPHSVLGAGTALADDAGAATGLVTGLEELVELRGGGRGRPLARGRTAADRPADDGPPHVPAIVLIVEDGAPVDRGRLTTLAEQGPDVNVHVIWVAATAERLPAACRDFVVVDREGSATSGAVRTGALRAPVHAETLTAPDALGLGRALAPVEDAGAVVEDATGLPQSVSFLTLAGPELGGDPSHQMERWRESGSLGRAPEGGRAASLRAVIGQGASGPMVLDLRSQGPHALVGGTTGAGKSEFLQSWVLGMAAAHSPARVTFLLVDYKGGAAFAECVALPHTVGLVTDLSPHLVRRALTSLRAELRYREHLLNAKKCKDLAELERTGDPDTPPSLVIVVDEFAALTTEVPEFVDGVVDVAQRGRSLGLHLILATQRPAGVIRDNLRANTNLRIALRMADEGDSNDVLGSPMAAHFDPDLPGRGAVRTGPGRIVSFQSAYAGARTSDAVERARVDVAELSFGRLRPWAEPKPPSAAPQEEVATDISRLVRVMGEAAQRAELPPPRKPWLPVLAATYDLSKLRQRTDTRLALGVVDDPDHQEQRTVHFLPDAEGNLAVYGTGGSGKSVLLRTLAASASITPRGGPVHVYGLDFGGGALTPLETLPNVGAIIQGGDGERVDRLLTWLRRVVDERVVRYAAQRAATLTEYRTAAGAPREPRLLLLVDGFPAFRQEYESVAGRSGAYTLFQQVLVDGRAVGVHVALSADRPASVPTSVQSSVQRTVMLRQADENAYLAMGAPRDILSAVSPAGRAVDLPAGLEMQVAVLGGSPSLAEQTRALERLAAVVPADQAYRAEPVRRLPEVVPAASLPAEVGGLPVLGVADDTLEPVGFQPSGTFLVSGPSSSGRTTTVLQLATALRRWRPDLRIVHLTGRASPLSSMDVWTASERALDAVVALAGSTVPDLREPPRPGAGPLVVVVEALADFLGTPAEAPLTELIKQARRNEHLVIAEADSSSWGSTWPLVTEVRSGRRGIALQPDQMEGDLLFRTSFPRVTRTEFPPGRGLVVESGKVRRVQIPLPDRGR